MTRAALAWSVAALALVATLGPRGYVTRWLEALLPLRVGDLAYGYTGALLALASSGPQPSAKSAST